MKKYIISFCAATFSLMMMSCSGGDDGTIATTGVKISRDEASIIVTQTIELTATVEPDDAANKSVIWESSDPAIADVSATGTVTGVTAGAATITATTEDGNYKVVCEITVEPLSLITSNSGSLHSLSLETGDEFTVTTNLAQVVADANIVWESGDTSLATVTGGVVKGITPGITTITAKAGKNKASTIVSVVAVPTISRCEAPEEGWFESLGRIYFKTDRIWTVGSQEWSDVVMAENVRTDEQSNEREFFNGVDEWCEDPTHAHPLYFCDARVNQTREYGDLFSWCAVAMYRKQLCPDGWRVPSSDDFRALNIALGGFDVEPGLDYVDTVGVIDKYANEWGADFGSICNNFIYLTKLGAVSAYWAVNEYDNMEAFWIEINKAVSKVIPQSFWRKGYGMEVRCVRDI